MATSKNSLHSDCAEIFSSDETKSTGNTLCITEHFCDIWRKKNKQDECRRIFRGCPYMNISTTKTIKQAEIETVNRL